LAKSEELKKERFSLCMTELVCDDGVASGIAETRKNPSTIINYTINAIHDDLRSLVHKGL